MSLDAYWKSEESDEDEDAAALRSIWGNGEEVRKLGSAPLDEFADNGDEVMTQAIDHVVGDTLQMSQLRKGATLGQEWGKPTEVPSQLW